MNTKNQSGLACFLFILVIIVVVTLISSINSSQISFRDKIQAAHREGVACGENGITVLANPYEEDHHLFYTAWKRGWIEGATK